MNTIHELQERIDFLRIQLIKTDYVAIKYAEGCLTATEYASVGAQRQKWRDEINACEVMIKRLKGE